MNIITLSARFSLLSDNDVLSYFVTQEQYEFVEIVQRVFPTYIDDKPYQGKIMKHYKIIYKDEVYYIPGVYSVVYDKPYASPFVTNKGAHEHYMMGNERFEKDCSRLYKKVFGREIKNNGTPDVATWLKKLLKNRNVTE